MTEGTAFNDVFAAEARRIRRKTSLSDQFTNTSNRAAIAEIRPRARQEMDVVRGQISLSEEGKRQFIARIWLNSDAEIKRLTQADADAHRARFNELERQVFGVVGNTDSQTISFRDATEKARAFTEQDDALDALGSATISGDTIYAKAIVLRAWTKGWADVVRAYTDAHPAVADKITELEAIAHWRDSHVSRLGGQIGANNPKPTELAGLTLKQITELAAAEEPTSKPGDSDYWKQNNAYTTDQAARIFGQG